MSTTATTATEQVQDEFSAFATGFDVDAMENRMRHGGLIPVGKYNAMLIGAQKVESKNKNTPNWELVFKLTAGPFKDQEVREHVYITDNSKSKDRLSLFGHRLGLLKRTADGKGLVKVDGKINLSDCLDTPCVIEIIHEPGDKDPNKMFTKLAFGGIWQPDHPDLKKSPPTNGIEDPKAAAAAAKTATAAASPPATDGAKKPKVSRGEL